MWSEELLETEPWGVDWGLASVDKCVVEEATDWAANEWSDDWNPEVVVSRTPDIATVADGCGEETWAQVTGWVDGETGLSTECDTNTSLKDCQYLCGSVACKIMELTRVKKRQSGNHAPEATNLPLFESS